ncbi:S46 family peptidase [Pendulispora brunnea]|uniref:Dipeptidyl-peptidase n=1 Tax=Pendulispora brunnea TaxID=2905690 RepID=A0ABZ2KD53_9BACT
MRTIRIAGALAWLLVTTGSTQARADEGLWPFDMIPKERIQKEHHTSIDDGWLDHVRLSSVAFGKGTGSFVSPTGLVLTNHHVGENCIDRLGRAGKDYMRDGFLAGRDGPEGKCAGLEVRVLQSIENVTEKVRAARKPDMNDAEANVAMKGVMAELERGCTRAGSRCEVVPLYAGGKYDLYTYKTYADVRLVFAPEQAMANFGGNTDNFAYPRYGFDVAIYRVYENDQPLHPKEYLSWNVAGPKEGETLFASGHPQSTERLLSMSQLATLRDAEYPYLLDHSRRMVDKLRIYSREGAEAVRQSAATLHAHENLLKAVGGWLRGLKDPVLMKRKGDEEASLRRAIDGEPKWKAAYGSLFDDIGTTQKKNAEIFKRYACLEKASYSRILRIARTLIRLPAELETADDKRLREYRDANLAALRLGLFSPAPIDGEPEVIAVQSWIETAVQHLGVDDPAVKTLLGGRTPARAAREVVAGSKLFDVYARRRLAEGGKQAIADSTDPAIVLMRALDPDARAIRKRYEDEVEAPSRKQGERMAQAVFAIRGTEGAPDATATLRLSVGVVKGYTENGKAIPWSTNVAGLYGRATGKVPYKLTPPWEAAKASLAASTPFNFVSTHDITTGSSGSPLVNAKGELTGLVFDGNASFLSNQFVYGDSTQRTVNVHPAVILEALDKVYGAGPLVRELTHT